MTLIRCNVQFSVEFCILTFELIKVHMKHQTTFSQKVKYNIVNIMTLKV